MWVSVSPPVSSCARVLFSGFCVASCAVCLSYVVVLWWAYENDDVTVLCVLDAVTYGAGEVTLVFVVASCVCCCAWVTVFSWWDIFCGDVSRMLGFRALVSIPWKCQRTGDVSVQESRSESSIQSCNQIRVYRFLFPFLFRGVRFCHRNVLFLCGFFLLFYFRGRIRSLDRTVARHFGVLNANVYPCK